LGGGGEEGKGTGLSAVKLSLDLEKSTQGDREEKREKKRSWDPTYLESPAFVVGKKGKEGGWVSFYRKPTRL